MTTAPVTLFAFERADEAVWDVVNDGVMGGRSAGFVAVEQGSLRFTGTPCLRMAYIPSCIHHRKPGSGTT